MRNDATLVRLVLVLFASLTMGRGYGQDLAEVRNGIEQATHRLKPLSGQFVLERQANIATGDAKARIDQFGVNAGGNCEWWWDGTREYLQRFFPIPNAGGDVRLFVAYFNGKETLNYLGIKDHPEEWSGGILFQGNSIGYSPLMGYYYHGDSYDAVISQISDLQIAPYAGQGFQGVRISGTYKGRSAELIFDRSHGWLLRSFRLSNKSTQGLTIDRDEIKVDRVRPFQGSWWPEAYSINGGGVLRP